MAVVMFWMASEELGMLLSLFFFNRQEALPINTSAQKAELVALNLL